MRSDVYTTDGYLSLIKLSEEDKDNYIELLKQISEINGFYDNPDNVELVWRTAFSRNELDYSIYDASGEYCGNIVLNHWEEPTPEIGIDLVEPKRNKGIAAKCIKLLARRVYEERNDIEHFILRVSSGNPHSRHMIEKMGAIYIGEEETLIKLAMKVIKDVMEGEDYKKVQDRYREFLEKKPEAEKEVVYRYKLTSDVF